MANGNRFLAMSSNFKFSPHNLSEFTCVHNMEFRIMKILFPEGHAAKDLTRRLKGKRLVLHYIPYIKCVRILVQNQSFVGKVYQNFETQWSTRHLGVCAIGSTNSGTNIQLSQYRVNHLARGSCLGKPGVETRVVGLPTATYGEKNMQ